MGRGMQQGKWWRFSTFDVCAWARGVRMVAFDYICCWCFVGEIVANYLILINSFHFEMRPCRNEGASGKTCTTPNACTIVSDLLLLSTIGGCSLTRVERRTKRLKFSILISIAISSGRTKRRMCIDAYSIYRRALALSRFVSFPFHWNLMLFKRRECIKSWSRMCK